MAFIPDEAIKRMTEISAGAWRLYCALAMHRNQKTGKCCPSVRTSAEAIDVHPKNIFKLRNELVKAQWARFNGDNVTDLLGFAGSKNTTDDVAAIEDMPTSSENATLRVVSIEDRPKGSKNTTPAEAGPVAKTLPLVAKTLLDGSKNATAYKEEPAKEPANRTSKGKARQPTVVPPAVAFIRHLTHRYPDKTLWPRIIKTLGEDFDEGRLTECYENWVSHGWNKMNFVWLFEWYPKGMPRGQNGNGRPTLADKNRAAGEEAARMLGIYDNVIEAEVL